METYGLEKLGIINAKAVYRNLTPAQLTEHALCRGEGTLSNTGALVVKTGKYTGRSANDKFIVIHVRTSFFILQILLLISVRPYAPHVLHRALRARRQVQCHLPRR